MAEAVEAAEEEAIGGGNQFADTRHRTTREKEGKRATEERKEAPASSPRWRQRPRGVEHAACYNAAAGAPDEKSRGS